MRRTIVKSLVVVLALIVAMGAFAGCFGDVNKSSGEYWFKDYNKSFEPYDLENGDINKAGTYWKMTAKRAIPDTAFMLRVRGGMSMMYSDVSVTVNGFNVKCIETPSNLYHYVFPVDIKKGDEIVIQAFWTNTAATDNKGFEIDVFALKVDGEELVISDIK